MYHNLYGFTKSLPVPHSMWVSLFFFQVKSYFSLLANNHPLYANLWSVICTGIIFFCVKDFFNSLQTKVLVKCVEEIFTTLRRILVVQFCITEFNGHAYYRQRFSHATCGSYRQAFLSHALSFVPQSDFRLFSDIQFQVWYRTIDNISVTA